MALTLAPRTDLTTQNNNNNNFFEEDDEDTWSQLVSLTPESADIGPRLESLSKRFHADFNAPPEFWDGLCKKVQNLGFDYSSGRLEKLPGSAVSGNGSSNHNFPAAFQSDFGKKHTKAVSSLLGVSEDRAVKITMSALRSVDSEGAKYQSLLGSRDLLMKTMLHHYQQRFARLSVVTECLRLEQDPDTFQRDSIVKFLDSIDSGFEDAGRQRGLYRRLLMLACAPQITPTRDQLEPCKALHDSSPQSFQDAIIVRSGDKGWNSFVGTCLEELRIQSQTERIQAMEALLVLLYDRIKGGVRRNDFALLLTAFNSSFNFFTDGVEGNRLSILAGMICAESMTLWRAFSPDIDPGVGWAAQHPLFAELSDSQQAFREIEVLKTLLHDISESISERQNSMMPSSEAPEALAMLSFGLLLHLASKDGFAKLGTMGSEMAMTANDAYGVFDYLHSVIHALTDGVPKSSIIVSQDEPFDWQFSELTQPLLLENQPEISARPDILAYTSIAREVLAAVIATFGSNLLAIDKQSSPENIAMLCNLAYKLYESNTMLCDQFWADWQSYSSPETPTSKFPMCSLMESAYKLAVGSLGIHDSDGLAGEKLVCSSAPFFRLLSALAHNAAVVETTLAVLPKGMIRATLLCCRSETLANNEDYKKSKVIILESFDILTRIGTSETCLNQLRSLLEESSDSVAIDGPRVLSRLLSTRISTDETKPVLQMMANLLRGAPQRWVLQLAQEIIISEETNYGLVAFLAPGSDSAHSASLILAGLIEHFMAVIFCDSFLDESAISFLHLLENGISSATSMLASSLSVATSSLKGRTAMSFETARTILQAFADFLKGLKSVSNIHRSERVRTAAVQVRDNLINALATSTSWGNAIAYYAVAPVSLSLSIKLQHVIDDQKILEQVSGESVNDPHEKSKNLGVWHSVLNLHIDHSGGRVAKESLLQFSDKMTLADFDLQGIQARGWTQGSDEASLIHAAWSAIRLLSCWAAHVEDIEQSHYDGAPENFTKGVIDSLSPQKLLTSLAAVPLPCRESSVLFSTWKNAGLSHFDLFLPYLSEAEQGGSLNFMAPTSPTLDFFLSCIGHVQASCPPETVADSMLFRAIYRSTRFSMLVKSLLERSLELSSQDNLTQKEKAAVKNGLLCLRISAACVETSASVADKLLHLDTADLIGVLVNAACKGQKVLSASDKSNNVFDTEESVMQMRLATGCLGVLASIWKTAFRSLQVREDSVRSRLCKIVEEQRALITVLITVIDLYGTGGLDSCIVPTWTTEHARCTIAMYVSTAFDLLTTELLYSVCAPGISVNNSLKTLLLVDFLPCERFSAYEGYRFVVQNSSMLDSVGMQKYLSGIQLVDVLKCFPAAASRLLLNDFYSNENAFDVASAINLVRSIGNGDIETIEDVISKVAISYQTTLCELQIIVSWKKFAESMVVFSSGDSEETKVSPNPERLFDFSHATMNALCQNVAHLERTPGDSRNICLKEEFVEMVEMLSQLSLFFLELSMGGKNKSFLPPTENLLKLLSLVTKTSENVFSIISADDVGNVAWSALKTLCVLQCPFIASTVAILGLIESTPASSIDSLRNMQDSSYSSICRVNGKILGVLIDVLKSSKVENDVMSMEQGHRDLLLCSIALSTALLTRGLKSGFCDPRYYNMVAETFQEYEVLPRLLQVGIMSSRQAVILLAEQKDSNTKPCKRFLGHINIVTTILSLLHSLAETNDRKMLAIFPKVSLAQFVVRNPLFAFASKKWVLPESDMTHKRGYIILNASPQAPSSGNGSVGRQFHVGIDDPVHDVWLATLKFTQAALRSSSNRLRPQNNEASSSIFFDIVVEFLCTHRESLLACLKLTGTKLTKKTLLEASHTLSLVAELCKRDIRDSFLRSQRSLCEVFVDWAKFTIVNISKFLGASGTSRELFLAIEEYESSDSEEITDEVLSGLRLKHRHPLLAEGLPSAKHEAVKYSHFASQFCERVTESDFKDASQIPDHLKKLAKDREHESDLERNCRLSVTCHFAISMEQIAASCLSQALSLIWRVHPVTFSFHSFSHAEVQNMDTMSLVRPGVVIGFRPSRGESLLTQYTSGSRLFDSLRFGRVRSSNTIKRTWEVNILRRREEETSTDEETEIVSVGQLAGIEDATMRRAITTYRPAPNNIGALGENKGVLSVGDLILILRWCHQESLSKNDCKIAPTPRNSIRVVAEQTVALLGAELAIHDEIGSPAGLTKADRSRLDSQIFELFADESILLTSEDGENTIPARYSNAGRLKGIVDGASLSSVRPQIEREVLRAWQEIQEKERRRREKRTFSNDTNWFSSVRRKGYGQKSAFRGLG